MQIVLHIFVPFQAVFYYLYGMSIIYLIQAVYDEIINC